MQTQAHPGIASTSVPIKTRWVYVGSHTEHPAQGQGISIYRMDTSTGKWTLSEVVRDLVNPMFLAFDRSGRYLYTVHGKHKGVSAFRIDPQTGSLTPIGFQPTGTNPVHLTPDPTNQYLIVANVGVPLGALHPITGNLAVLPIHADGTLGPLSDSVSPECKPEANQTHKPQARPHHCPFDPSGQFIVAPDMGQHKVFVFRLDADTGKLVRSDAQYADTTPGARPRHVDFHPSGSWAYVVNDRSTINAYRMDRRSGTLTLMQTISTIPSDFKGKNAGSEIFVTPNGKFLYASNRGHDSLAIYSIDQSSGMLALKSWESTQGKRPRFFGFDPTGHFLYAANHESHTIVAFRVDQESGKLTSTGQVVTAGSPVCIVFADYEF